MLAFLKRKYERFKFYLTINWPKTIYFNFKMFPFSIASKLPIYFYGRVKFTKLTGSVKIEAPSIKRGMIGFGQKFETTTQPKGIANFILKGELVFKGHAHIGRDYLFYVGNDAYCEFGYMGCLGSDVKLVCTKKIVIGQWTGIGYESQLMDSNFHPMINTVSGKHYPMNGEIVLGDYNAFSNRITVMHGTMTPDHCVIASNSLLNKDYRPLGSKVLIGGIPAKLIKTDFARDWESEKESLKKLKRVKD